MSESGSFTRMGPSVEVPIKNSCDNYHREYQPFRLHNVGITPLNLEYQLTNMESITPFFSYLFLSHIAFLFSFHLTLIFLVLQASRVLNSGTSYTMRLIYTHIFICA